MGKFKSTILGLFTVFAVLIAGCEKEERASLELIEPKTADEAFQIDEADVDPYWAQPVDSEICRTVGECRDLGDTYGSDHFDAFCRALSFTDEPWLLNTGTASDEYGYNKGYEDDEKIIAKYEIKDDHLVLASGVEEDIFKDIADAVLALYDRSQIDFRVLTFQKDVYSHVMVNDGETRDICE